MLPKFLPQSHALFSPIPESMAIVGSTKMLYQVRLSSTGGRRTYQGVGRCILEALSVAIPMQDIPIPVLLYSLV